MKPAKPPKSPKSIGRLPHALALLTLLGCVSEPAAPPPPSSTAPPAAATEAAPAAPESVPPGLNDEFLSPELDVERFVGIFEGESREIARQRDVLVQALGLRPGLEVADVGAGTGLFLASLAAAVGPRGRVFAVDLSPRFLEFLRERVEAEGLENVEVVACTDRSVELPRASVDLVLLCDTYHHFEHPAQSLASIRRALRRGGALVVVEFERIPGVSRPWVLEHVRAGREEFAAEIVAAGFEYEEELEVGLEENYALRFRRP